jgi:hypothetical protein
MGVQISNSLLSENVLMASSAPIPFRSPMEIPITGLCWGMLMYNFSMYKNTIISLKDRLFLLYDAFAKTAQSEEIPGSALSER